MTFLQGLRLLFMLMLVFGVFFQLKGGEKGPAVRAYEFALIGVGAAGSLVMLAFGLGTQPGQGVSRAKCAECGEPMPLARRPANRRQLLWGGWTCAKCGSELDRSGRKVEKTD